MRIFVTGPPASLETFFVPNRDKPQSILFTLLLTQIIANPPHHHRQSHHHHYPSLVPGVLAAVLHVQHLGRAQHQVRAQHRPWQLSLPGEHVKSFDETE